MTASIGFIGTGVMGEPMCRNMAAKSGRAMVAFDLDPEPLARLAEVGVVAADSVAAVAGTAELVFLSLPGGEQLAEVCQAPGGLLESCRPGQTVVDTSTSPVALSRELAARFAERGIDYADAPIARTRQAAIEGTLSIMVGAGAEVFARIRPLLACCASEVSHCGPVGAGQVIKLMNNMVLVQTVLALSEALTIARRAGLEGEVLFDTLTKGSADSFALRNHGFKALLPGAFPERAFSTEYAQKDLRYALELAAETGVEASGAENAAAALEASRQAGFGANYWPALINVVDPGGKG
jgi:hypothetical protein